MGRWFDPNRADMQTFKQRCISLRKRDYTLTEIASLTKRSKSSVYFHVRNMELTAKKKDLIRAETRKRAIRIASQRRGKSVRTFTSIHSWSANTVYIVAHFMFDGEISQGGCIYNNRNKSLLDSMEHAMKEIYAFEPKRYTNRATGVHRISYFNVALSAHMRTKVFELLQEIGTLPTSLQRVFLRAFFDDEGCMDYRPARGLRRVRGYQKSNKVLTIVQLLLRNFDIEAALKSGNEVVIAGKHNLRSFQNYINFSPGVRINGKRTNSLWKKSFEKRELLRRAIDSFVS
jgi:intein-encoded DNA endonuclease-like protein